MTLTWTPCVGGCRVITVTDSVGWPNAHTAALAAVLGLAVVLQVARVIEIVTGHVPSPESDAVFGLAVSGLLVLAGAGRTVKGP